MFRCVVVEFVRRVGLFSGFVCYYVVLCCVVWWPIGLLSYVVFVFCGMCCSTLCCVVLCCIEVGRLVELDCVVRWYGLCCVVLYIVVL